MTEIIYKVTISLLMGILTGIAVIGGVLVVIWWFTSMTEIIKKELTNFIEGVKNGNITVSIKDVVINVAGVLELIVLVCLFTYLCYVNMN